MGFSIRGSEVAVRACLNRGARLPFRAGGHLGGEGGRSSRRAGLESARWAAPRPPLRRTSVADGLRCIARLAARSRASPEWDVPAVGWAVAATRRRSSRRLRCSRGGGAQDSPHATHSEQVAAAAAPPPVAQSWALLLLAWCPCQREAEMWRAHRGGVAPVPPPPARRAPPRRVAARVTCQWRRGAAVRWRAPRSAADTLCHNSARRQSLAVALAACPSIRGPCRAERPFCAPALWQPCGGVTVTPRQSVGLSLSLSPSLFHSASLRGGGGGGRRVAVALGGPTLCNPVEFRGGGPPRAPFEFAACCDFALRRGGLNSQLGQGRCHTGAQVPYQQHLGRGRMGPVAIPIQFWCNFSYRVTDCPVTSIHPRFPQRTVLWNESV